MQFNISLVLLAVLDREADSSHLVLAKADNFDYIAQSQNILYAVDTLFCNLGNVNHSLFARCKLKECAELFDADNFTGKYLPLFKISYDDIDQLFRCSMIALMVLPL